MKLNWGVLGVAKIAREKVIPAMAGSELYQVKGIASRKLEKAQEAAKKLDIPKAYGSYEELIEDPDIHIIYNPLPNHLHYEYTLKCIEAGKHVLCEKPLALQAEDVKKLIEARNKHGVKVGEAFMVRTHPQWLKTRELVQSGALGNIKLIQGSFSYFNTNPDNIRNIADYGGGAVWDIGCYPVHTARFVLGEEPLRLVAHMEKDPEMGTDIFTGVMMQFRSCTVQFGVSTQLSPYQRMHFLGDKQELEVQIPFNAPNDRSCVITLNNGDVFQDKLENLVFEQSDQYSIQAEAFSRAVLENTEVPVPLEDSLANTKVLEAIFLSAKEGRWVDISSDK
ncbi:oxidoreductase domain-containing protein [Flammeovirgaceae bacterium 311]|nr:oxidoreductase domain-containing protein [Flammeovirgaceae bacterium 311]